MATGARQALWQAAEPIHALVYFDRGVRRAVRAAGAPGFWAGYFGTRLAPLQTGDPWLATAVLYVFARPMVAEHLPAPADGAAWDAARRSAVREVLAGLGGAAAPPAGAWLAAGERVRAMVAEADPAGRPLFAAHAGRPWPDDPWLALWHGVTVLRELRGDGHVHALATAGLSGCEALLLALLWRGDAEAAERIAADDRGWDAAAVAAAYGGLAERGWLGQDRRLTDAGCEARAAIEDATDALSLPPGTGDDAVEAALAALAPLAALAVPHIPAVNPIGIRGTGP
ncbi:MAG TPA: hypothetical protein VFI47_16105 [Acidimicrobiales bacterium]|nr:hypothetical protein [Acidimicrobiales bacterium]